MKLRLISLAILAVLIFASCRDRLVGPPNNPATSSDTIAYWTFVDGSSGLKDVTGNGHNGSVTTNIQYVTDRFGNPGSALLLNGKNDVSVQNTANLNFSDTDSYSISGWINLSNSDTNFIISKDFLPDNVGRTGSYAIYSIRGQFYAQITGNSPNSQAVWLYSNNPVPFGEWHMVTLVVAAHSSATLYIDSTMVTSKTDTMTWNNPINDFSPLLIGAPAAMNPTHDSITLDDFIIFHHAMSASDVQARFHEGGWSEGYALQGLVWTNSTSGDFGNVQLNSSVVKNLHAFDNASFACAIQSVTITGADASEFSVGSLTLPATVSHQDSIIFPITWQPAGSTGSHTATLTVTYSGQSGSQTLTMPLNGTVTSPATGFFQGSFGTSQAIEGICFAWVDTVYACGFNGTILRSIDGGMTWVPQNSGTTQNLYRIRFQDWNNGIAGGDNGTLLKTTNAGAVWTQLTFPNTPAVNIRDIYWSGFKSQQNPQGLMMVVGGANSGTEGVILTSTDAGVSWSVAKTTSAGALYGIGFNPEGNIFHVVGNSGQILSSSDMGVTWYNQSVNEAGDDFLAIDYCPLNNFSYGMATTAYGTIYSDYSSSWTQNGMASSGVQSGLRTVKLTTTNEVWIAGDNGVILHSTNSGMSWSRADINGVSVQWNEIAARDAHTLAFVGANGTLYWYKY